MLPLQCTDKGNVFKHVLKDELRQRNETSYSLDFRLKISVSNVGICPLMLVNISIMQGRRMCILLLQLKVDLEKVTGE